jgi:hypothetical protein
VKPDLSIERGIAMTEIECLACKKPYPMFRFLQIAT